MSKIDEIRAKLKAIEDKKSSGTKGGGGDKTSYPFWDIKDGDTATIRFLPDKNDKNTFFWVERQLIKLPFKGIKGVDEDREVTIQVPCVEMWGEKCPVMREVSPWFDDKDLEDLARKYWKKRTYLFQGIVREDPLTGVEKPENPIRKFIIGPQIYKLIKAALMDPDMESDPTDFLNGIDFRLNKTQDGKYASYSSSTWARRESSLTEEELEQVTKYGLNDLETFLPERPSPEHVAAIYEMFKASLDGEMYDPERWAKYYKPYNLNVKTDESAPAKKSAAPVDDGNEDIPFEVETPSRKVEAEVVIEKVETSTQKAESKPAAAPKDPKAILDMLRQRSNAS